MGWIVEFYNQKISSCFSRKVHITELQRSVIFALEISGLKKKLTLQIRLFIFRFHYIILCYKTKIQIMKDKREKWGICSIAL